MTNYDAVTKGFKIRDVGVAVAVGTTTYDTCPATLADGLFVEVKGSLGPTGIVAKQIKCAAGDPTGAIVERRGLASNVVLLTNAFTLTPAADAPLTVRWSALTFFRDGLLPTRASLEGTAVRVEGVTNPSTGVLLATKIRLDN